MLVLYAEEAIGDAVEENYGTYQYVKLKDIIDNYMVGYVGDGKIIQTLKNLMYCFLQKDLYKSLVTIL